MVPENALEDDDADFTPNENQCHLCRKQLLSKDDLINHVKTKHEAYFQGMLDVAASMTNFDEAEWSRVSHRPMVWPDWLLCIICSFEINMNI